MMSGSVVGSWASIVSFAPPPVAPTRRTPPVRSLPAVVAPPLWVLDELLPPLPPHAASRPPALSAAPPALPRRSTSRRVISSSQPGRGSLLILVLLVVVGSSFRRLRGQGRAGRVGWA